MKRLLRRRAFSLIEMLVVIGIIAILAAIVFPAVESARRQANTATCANNLKQIGFAVKAYLTDHSDVFPPVEDWLRFGLIADIYREYLGGEYGVFRCPAQKATPAQLGAIGAQVRFPSDATKHVTYEFNGFYCYPPNSYIRTATKRDVTNAAIAAYAYDYPYTAWGGSLGDWRPHRGGMNVLYLDWHVAWLDESDYNLDGPECGKFYNRGHLCP